MDSYDSMDNIMRRRSIGELRKTFSTNQISRYILLLIGIACLSGGLYSIIKVFSDTKEPVILIIVSLISVGICLLGVLMLRRFWRTRGGRIELYENGLIAHLNGKHYIANWNDIVSVKEFIEAYYINGIHTSDRYVYTIETISGDTFSFDNVIFQTKQIGQEIKEETFNLMYQPALQKIKTGRAINFGSLSISSNGVSENSTQFLWSNLGAVNVKDGIIQIKDKDGNPVIEIVYAATPNVHVLMVLLHEFISG